MDAKAVKLIDLILQWEGGYSDHSYDGHETYRGITRKNHSTWNGWKIVDAHKPLKYNQIIKDNTLENNVRKFYYKYYYIPMKINSIDNLLTAGQLFAMGVNAGSKTAIKLLQKAINNVYNDEIAVDGIIGRITLEYVNGSKSFEVSQEMVNQCNSYYESIVATNPSKKKFLNGWKNRVQGVSNACSSKVSHVLITTLKRDNWFTKLLKYVFKMVISNNKL